MHLQDRGNVGVLAIEGLAIVGEPGAIRRADVDELRARLLHHLGDAEAAADLDAFAAADDDLAIASDRGENEQHRGRVVVDHDRRLGAAQHCQQRADRVLPRPALAGAEVELDVDRGRPGESARTAPGRGWCAATRRSR